MEATNATEIADESTKLDDSSGTTPEAGAANESKGSVADAFDRGVLGGELPNVPIPPDPVEPDPVPHKHEPPPIDLAREASSYIDQARAHAARIASMEGDISDRLLEAADPLIDKLDAIMSELDRAKVDLARAEAEATSRYRDLPGIDAVTKKQVENAAKSKAHDDLLKERTTKLEQLANEAASLAAVVEKQINFENRFADPELREALDGQRLPAEKASEDWLTSRLESQPLSETSETYELLLLSKDADRVRRFERSALSAIANVLAGIEKVSAPPNKLSAEAKDRLSRERSAALELRAKIQAQRASRRPKSIEHGEQLLSRLHSAWSRIAGFDARRGAGAVSPDQMAAMRNDDSRMAQARAQARSWKPMEGWHSRHFRKK